MTIRAGIVGYPAMHSLSPTIHNAGYKFSSLDWEYFALDIMPGLFAHDMAHLVDEGWQGFNVTTPHKDAAFEFCDHTHGAAQRLKTVNTIVHKDNAFHGYSTDGLGLVNFLSSQDIAVYDSNILLIGAGGAARSIADALYEAGAHICIASRKKQASQDLCDAISAAHSIDEQLVPGSAISIDFNTREEVGEVSNIIINATPVGMTRENGPDNSVPMDVSRLSSHNVVVDTIYHPLETEFLRRAREQGCSTHNGAGMLLHQGALAFTLMTGVEAPIDVMRAALDRELDKRSRQERTR